MAKLSSYTIVDFPTKAQLNLFLKYVEQRNNDKLVIQEMKDAGLLKRIVSQIWNATNAYRIGITYEYKNEDIDKLILEAKIQNLKLITTEKDYVKIKDNKKLINTLQIEMELDLKDKAVFNSFLQEKLNG